MARQSNDANAPLVPTVQYRDVGTSIDCIATVLDDGRFKLNLTVEDSSLEAGANSGGTSTSTHPAFRSFRTSDTVLLRDGQSAQYSTATDRVTGDVWKVDVTLTVIK
jgi:Flp pilus assembly secretin CpaC